MNFTVKNLESRATMMSALGGIHSKVAGKAKEKAASKASLETAGTPAKAGTVGKPINKVGVSVSYINSGVYAKESSSTSTAKLYANTSGSVITVSGAYRNAGSDPPVISGKSH